MNGAIPPIEEGPLLALARERAAYRGFGFLGSTGAYVQEERNALPAVRGFLLYGMVGDGWIPKRLDKQSCLLKCEEIALNGAMLAVERHGQPLPFDGIGVAKGTQIIAFDHVGRVGSFFLEVAG